MKAKAIESSINKTSLKKLRLHYGEYQWKYAGVIIRNDGTIMLYLILKIINPATMIGVST